MSYFPEIFVILPAAEGGLRYSYTPKQYSKILNKPLIWYTVDQFVSIPWVKRVVIIAAPNFMQWMNETLSFISADSKAKLMIVEGSTTRHLSIHLGLKAIKAFKPEMVVIHDGVRPFVSQDILIKVIIASRDYGAAGIIRPLVSNIIEMDENVVLDDALEKYKHYGNSEMPQAFKYPVILDAYSKCPYSDMALGTECLDLVLTHLNRKVRLINGTKDLWKVAHRKDLYAAEGIIKEKRTVAVIDRCGTSKFLDTLKDALSKRFCNVIQGEHSEFFPLTAKVYHEETISDVIEEVCALYHSKQSEHCRAIVYISLKRVAVNEDFWFLQNKVKSIAEQTRSKGLGIYFIATNSAPCNELYQEISEMASSLLFDCNFCLSGQILCL